MRREGDSACAVRRSGGPALPRGPRRRRRHEQLREEEIVAWSVIDRLGVAACWAAGLLLCAIAGAIVIYMLFRGLQYVNHRRARATPGHLVDNRNHQHSRRLPRSDRGHPGPDALGTLIAFPVGVAHGGLAERVRQARWARPRGRVGRRDRRRHADHRPRDLRPSDLLAGSLRLPLLHRRGRRGLRPLLLHRRDHDVADRASPDRRRHPGGAPVDPHPRPRSVLRPRQGQDLHHPPGAASRLPQGRSPPGSPWGWAGSPATPRS